MATAKKKRVAASAEIATTPAADGGIMAGELLSEPTTELSIEQIAKQQLAQYGLPDQKIAQLEADYGKLTIAGPEDKETYKTATAALTMVRGYRTGVENKRKELKAPYWNAGLAIDAEAKRLTGKLEPIEKHLSAQIKATDDAIERIRKAKEIERVEKLTDAGFQLVGQAYIAGKVVLHWDNITSISDEGFEQLIADGKAAVEEQRQERERQQKEQEEIEKKRQELEQLERQLEAKRKELQAAEQPEPAPGIGHNGGPDIWDGAAEHNGGAIFTPQSATPSLPIGSSEPQQSLKLGGEVTSPFFPSGPTSEATSFRAAPGSHEEFVLLGNSLGIGNNLRNPAFHAGFDFAKKKILNILADPTPIRRSELQDRINSLTPTNS